MQTSVSVTFGAGAYVPASIGGEPIWQQPVSTIRVGDMVRICVDGTHSALFTSHGVADVSADVPAPIADDHAAIVAWWSVEIERQEAEAETIRLEAARDEAIRRLARKAREQGVRLCQDTSGRYFASSASRPGTWHYVTGLSCDCLGFHRHQRCMHHSALLVGLGWVADDTTVEPDPISIAGTGHARSARPHISPSPMPPARNRASTGIWPSSRRARAVGSLSLRNPTRTSPRGMSYPER